MNLINNLILVDDFILTIFYRQKYCHSCNYLLAMNFQAQGIVWRKYVLRIAVSQPDRIILFL
jgi:hypothetical protein